MTTKPLTQHYLLFALFNQTSAQFDTVEETRHAIRKVMGQADHLRDRLSRIESVSWLADDPLDVQRLMFATASRVGAIEDRVSALEQQLEQKTKEAKPRRTKHG